MASTAGGSAAICRIAARAVVGYELTAMRGWPRNRYLQAGLMAAILLASRAAWACDMCAVYTATEAQITRTGFRVGVAEQYTPFNDLQDAGNPVPNPAGEFINSSITQFVLGYAPAPRYGIQINVPYIYRGYRKNQTGGPVNGHVTGAGDLSIIGHAILYEYLDIALLGHFQVYGGLKLPSGSTALLGEEVQALPDPCAGIPPEFCTARRPTPRHSGGVPSGVHGHDLTLGSGSVDVVLGANTFWAYDRWYAMANAQYILRTPGTYDYQFANELSVVGGPGVFLITDHRFTLGVQAFVGCDTKGNDTLAGKSTGDTAMTSLYAGPAVRATVQQWLTAEVAVDIPVIQNNSGLQLVPEYRVRGAFMMRF